MVCPSNAPGRVTPHEPSLWEAHPFEPLLFEAATVMPVHVSWLLGYETQQTIWNLEFASLTACKCFVLLNYLFQPTFVPLPRGIESICLVFPNWRLCVVLCSFSQSRNTWSTLGPLSKLKSILATWMGPLCGDTLHVKQGKPEGPDMHWMCPQASRHEFASIFVKALCPSPKVVSRPPSHSWKLVPFPWPSHSFKQSAILLYGVFADAEQFLRKLPI